MHTHTAHQGEHASSILFLAFACTEDIHTNFRNAILSLDIQDEMQMVEERLIDMLAVEDHVLYRDIEDHILPQVFCHARATVANIYHMTGKQPS